MYQNNLLTFSQPGDIADSMPNSRSHRSDYVNACLDMWCQKVAFGTDNVTNPGFFSTAEVLESDADFYQTGAITPRSNCIMDNSELAAVGIRMPSVREALHKALSNWKAELIPAFRDRAGLS